MKYLATVLVIYLMHSFASSASTDDEGARRNDSRFEQRTTTKSNDQREFRTAGVYGSEKRETFEDYAARRTLSLDALHKQYAATGVIRCGDRQASAQLTGKMDILTTSAHIFFDLHTCSIKAANANSCEFSTRGPTGWAKYNVKERLAIGFTCPLNKDQGTGQAWGQDWAILKLEKPILDVTPYALPSSSHDVHKDDEAVVAVAGAGRDFYRIAPNGKKFYPRTIQHCSVKFIRDVSGEGAYVETDCDNAELSSGGSLLRPTGGGTILLGIFLGSFEPTALLEEALSQNRKNVRPYTQGQWAAIYASLDGRFLEELRKAVANSPALSGDVKDASPKKLELRVVNSNDQLLYGIPDSVSGALVVSSTTGFREGEVILEPSIQAISGARADIGVKVRTLDGRIESRILRR